MLFCALLRRIIENGELTLFDAHGLRHDFGTPNGNPPIIARLHDASLHWKLALNPRLMLGQAFMDRTLTVDDGGTIYDLLMLLGGNASRKPVGKVDACLTRVRLAWRRFGQANPLSRSRQNVAHHYDLSSNLYELFLDPRRQYSCAFFAYPEMSLEEAQVFKLNHIAAKLMLRPDHKVLDIGCGWGGLAIHLAETTGAHVTGITLSEEQHAYAVARAAERGLSDRVSFHLRDYRDERGTYDRVVSVGMFEHVGVPNYDTFFRCVWDRLAEDGVSLVHTIVQMNAPRPTNPWLAKYIFPGGYCPSPSEVLRSIEKSMLIVADTESLRLHYAETLRHWRRAFMNRWDDAAKLYDERFCRMWEFYLAGSEMGFRADGHLVMQFQLTRDQQAVPLTRDYLYANRPVSDAHVSDCYSDRRVA